MLIRSYSNNGEGEKNPSLSENPTGLSDPASQKSSVLVH